MICPKCQAPMRQYERQGVTIDQCSDCRGVFLDRGELERLVDAENRWNANTRGGGSHVPQPPQAPGYPPQQPGYSSHQPGYPSPGYTGGHQPGPQPGYGSHGAPAYGGHGYSSHGSHGGHSFGGHHGHRHHRGHRRKKHFFDELFD